MGVIKTYKKTATIDAIRWNGSYLSTLRILNWAMDHGVTIEWVDEFRPLSQKLKIPTLEGPMFAVVGDFIAKGINNEFWAIKPEIMEKTYQEV
jgi:hypothetical protein